MPYSEKFKARMVKKMTGPGAVTATALSKEVGVSQSALSSWLRQAKVVGMTADDQGPKDRSSRRGSPEDKLRVVREAAGLDEAALGAFLRREGLHEADLQRLREEVEELARDGLEARRSKRGPSPEEKRIRQLEKELRRKDKALAEAAALLVLQGKVRAFLSGDEEGDTDESNER